MLNGQDPIIIFQLGKILPRVGGVIDKIPLISEIPTIVEQPPIPIYLAEQLTGLFIDSEAKNGDVQTDVETKTDGSDPSINQKGLNNSVTIDLKARLDSTGVTLLVALLDVIYNKLTSKEYAITYLNGPITVFRGLLGGYSVNRDPNEDIYRVTITLSKGSKNSPTKKLDTPEAEKITGTVPL